jgi:peptidoglycan/xylan/chitin deacetylase (PgdA/CDA1 family)
MSRILLSFDVEEFDIPLEYNNAISLQEQMQVGKQGLDILIPVLEKYNLPTTLYTTALFAQNFSDTIADLCNQHEIASHTFYHSKFEEADLLASKQALEKITGKQIYGLRMPRMRAVDMAAAKAAGYLYDSSINPTYLPGRYNNTHLARTVYTEKEMVRIPASVSPFFRLPLFWLGFKNYPYKIFLKLCEQTLKKDGYINLYFHPWEFIDITNYNLPKYVTRYSHKKLLLRLEQLINDLSKHGNFATTNQFLTQNNFI